MKASYIIPAADIFLFAILALKTARSHKKFSAFLAPAAFLFFAAGDFFLVVMGGGAQSKNFLLGATAFSAAQACFILFFTLNGKFSAKTFAVLFPPFAMLFVMRIMPAVGSHPTAAVLAVYALLSVLCASFAFGSKRIGGYALWCAASLSLLASDTMIAYSQILNAAEFSKFVGPLYAAAVPMFAVATWRNASSSPFDAKKSARAAAMLAPCAAVAGTAATAALFAKAWVCVDKFNPLFSMLSRMGRERLKDQINPPSGFYFTAAMAAAAVSISLFLPALKRFAGGKRARRAFEFSSAAIPAGLLIIGFIPEDFNMAVHNVGCIFALLGGICAVASTAFSPPNPLYNRTERVFSLTVLAIASTAFTAAIILSALKLAPFSPYAPIGQKTVIILFAAWANIVAFKAFVKARATYNG